MKYILQYDTTLSYLSGSAVKAKAGYAVSQTEYYQMRYESRTAFQESEEPLGRLELAQYRADKEKEASNVKEELEAVEEVIEILEEVKEEEVIEAPKKEVKRNTKTKKK